jgi:hypothetical protein
LRDEFLWKVEIEVGDEHAVRFYVLRDPSKGRAKQIGEGFATKRNRDVEK